MKEFFKNLKWGMLLASLVSLALGLTMLLAPQVVETSLRFLLGGGLALFGVLEIVFVFARPNGLLSVGRLVPGILALAVGLVFLFRFDTFVSLLWILVGISVLIDGVYKLEYAFDLKRAGVKNWWINLLLSLIALVFAAVLLIEPFDSGRAMIYLAGSLLLANGLFDLTSLVMMSVFAKALRYGNAVLLEEADEEENMPVRR